MRQARSILPLPAQRETYFRHTLFKTTAATALFEYQNLVGDCSIVRTATSDPLQSQQQQTLHPRPGTRLRIRKRRFRSQRDRRYSLNLDDLPTPPRPNPALFHSTNALWSFNWTFVRRPSSAFPLRNIRNFPSQPSCEISPVTCSCTVLSAFRGSTSHWVGVPSCQMALVWVSDQHDFAALSLHTNLSLLTTRSLPVPPRQRYPLENYRSSV